MVQFKLNGKGLTIPSTWEDITFRQYLKILSGPNNTTELIALFTGIDCETLNKSTIIGLDDVLIALSFVNKMPIIPEEPAKIGPYSLISRQNIKFESLALFEDMKSVAMKANPKDIVDFTSRYGDYVAMYLQKVRDGEYSFEKAKAMRPEIDELPALEVISLGAFFFIKLGILLSGTKPNSPPTNQSPKKSRRVTKSSPKRSASTGRSRKSR